MVMGDTAEVVAKRYKVSREEQDKISLLSQQRIARAQEDGFFKEEIAPMQVTRGIIDPETKKIGKTEEWYVDKDECNRGDTTLEGLAKLGPVFDTKSGQGSVTAGNSSQLSDGASATLVMSMEKARSSASKPKMIYRGYAVSGCEPDEMGIGPVFAVPKLMKRQGIKIDDVDVWELNEAFASQVVYIRDKLGLDPAKLNPNGGSISIGTVRHDRLAPRRHHRNELQRRKKSTAWSRCAWAAARAARPCSKAACRRYADTRLRPARHQRRGWAVL